MLYRPFPDEQSKLEKMGYCIDEIYNVPMAKTREGDPNSVIKVVFWIPGKRDHEVDKTNLLFENMIKCLEFFEYFAANGKENIQRKYTTEYYPKNLLEIFPNQWLD